MTTKSSASRYKVQVVDLDYYRNQISCQAACPVHTDARGYVNDVADGDYDAGYIRARQPNPFASTCGRVCAAHCEKACRRGKIDSPITIRALKRFLCERYGVETLSRLPLSREMRKEAGIALLSGEGKKPPDNAVTVDSASQFSGIAENRAAAKRPRDARVAVIGAGPTGLTAAHDLALLGYEVTVFEGAPAAGGMAMLGIPEYRLPRDVLKLEMGEILGLGVDLQLSQRLGADFNVADLKNQGFEAIFLGIGAHKDRQFDMEGMQLDGVLAAVDFLLNVNLGYNVELGDKVVVVGGGDVAVDAARVAARLGDVYDLLAAGELVTAVDVARNALRLGVREVHMVYRGAREEMRASEEEMEGALEEGTILHTGLVPKRILGSGGLVTGLETLKTRSVYDDTGRRRLEPVPGSEATLPCNSVILAIGQESDLSFIQPGDGIEASPQGTLVADPETLATTAPGVFAGGDVVFGPRTVIEAVEDGHRAARGIDNYLQGGQGKVVYRGWMQEVPHDYLPDLAHQQADRRGPPKIHVDRRTGVSEVEMVYDEASAQEQAERCLKCHVQTVFDGNLCILCGGCVDVCPMNCYKMVPVEKIEGSSEVADLIEARYGEDSLATKASGAGATESRGTAMIKDDTQCVRCGLCQKRCPTGAITMEAFWFEEQLVYPTESE